MERLRHLLSPCVFQVKYNSDIESFISDFKPNRQYSLSKLHDLERFKCLRGQMSMGANVRTRVHLVYANVQPVESNKNILTNLALKGTTINLQLKIFFIISFTDSKKE